MVSCVGSLWSPTCFPRMWSPASASHDLQPMQPCAWEWSLRGPSSLEMHPEMPGFPQATISKQISVLGLKNLEAWNDAINDLGEDVIVAVIRCTEHLLAESRNSWPRSWLSSSISPWKSKQQIFALQELQGCPTSGTAMCDLRCHLNRLSPNLWLLSFFACVAFASVSYFLQQVAVSPPPMIDVVPQRSLSYDGAPRGMRTLPRFVAATTSSIKTFVPASKPP